MIIDLIKLSVNCFELSIYTITSSMNNNSFASSIQTLLSFFPRFLMYWLIWLKHPSRLAIGTVRANSPAPPTPAGRALNMSPVEGCRSVFCQNKGSPTAFPSPLEAASCFCSYCGSSARGACTLIKTCRESTTSPKPSCSKDCGVLDLRFRPSELHATAIVFYLTLSLLLSGL